MNMIFSSSIFKKSYATLHYDNNYLLKHTLN